MLGRAEHRRKLRRKDSFTRTPGRPKPHIRFLRPYIGRLTGGVAAGRLLSIIFFLLFPASQVGLAEELSYKGKTLREWVVLLRTGDLAEQRSATGRVERRLAAILAAECGGRLLLPERRCP
jgi:hypothetical protein